MGVAAHLGGAGRSGAGTRPRLLGLCCFFLAFPLGFRFHLLDDLIDLGVDGILFRFDFRKGCLHFFCGALQFLHGLRTVGQLGIQLALGHFQLFAGIFRLLTVLFQFGLGLGDLLFQSLQLFKEVFIVFGDLADNFIFGQEIRKVIGREQHFQIAGLSLFIHHPHTSLELFVLFFFLLLSLGQLFFFLSDHLFQTVDQVVLQFDLLFRAVDLGVQRFDLLFHGGFFTVDTVQFVLQFFLFRRLVLQLLFQSIHIALGCRRSADTEKQIGHKAEEHQPGQKSGNGTGRHPGDCFFLGSFHLPILPFWSVTLSGTCGW